MRPTHRRLGHPLVAGLSWIVAFGLSLSAPLWAGDTSAQARAIINRMSLAARTLNYKGTLVYLRGSHAVSMQVIHKAEVDTEQERLISLSGPAREVIRKDGEVTCIFPDNRAIMVDKTPPRRLLASTLPQPIEKIADLYSFSVLGGDRIAGRPAWVLGIVPKQPDRYGYRLWIDTSTHLLLRSNVIDASGTVLEQVLFTAIDTPQHIADEMLKPSISGQGYTWYTNEPPVPAGASAKSGQWQIGWLPQGFTVQGQGVQAMAASREPVNHVLISDGLATVSVFIERFTGKTDRIEELSSVGAINTYSTVAHGYQITGVGEVPAATLRQIADSVTDLPKNP
jgi:sigma-E factor negative regulatory protein RseB